VITRIFGANWKTTVSGVGAALFEALTVLSGLSYALGDVATVIPPTLKAKVLVVSLGSGFALKVWNAIAQKTKNVTGGTTQQTTTGAFADAGTQTLVDETVVATIKSGKAVTPEQKQAVS
jgi:hypothetical protein